jgi:uncharacterized protein YdaU (DUF1376 family)
MAKDTYYFSHDYNARSDDKVKRLIRHSGMEAYGIYWAIIEDLYNNANELKLDYEGIAYDLRCKAELVRSVICDFDLFVIDGKVFGSASVERRLNERMAKSKKAAESAKHRWAKKQEADAIAQEKDAKALQTHKEPTVEQQQEPEQQEPEQQEPIKLAKPDKNSYKNVLLSQIESDQFTELNPTYIEVAKAFQSLFRATLIEANASTKNVDSTKGTAVDEIRLIIESDGYSVNDLRAVFDYLNSETPDKNGFSWRSNVLSFTKLRKQMDKILIKISNAKRADTTRRAGQEATSWNELATIVQHGFAAS